MLARIARFEFRYQLRNPVFWVTAGIFFLLTFGAMTVEGVQIAGGGNTHGNAPVAGARIMAIMSLFFMFVTTAFVSNVIVRDDDTGYGPIVRSTRVRKSDYLFGRFLGAFAVAALCFLAVPFGIWLGAHMPWLDPDTLGPNRLADLAIPYAVLALPNILVTSAIFFALATATRSMMTTYVGVVAFLIAYTILNVSLRDQPQLQDLRALLEPFGIGAINNATRYWTATESNSMLPPLKGALLWNRLLWLGLSSIFLAVAYGTYRFSDKPQSKRAARRQAGEAMVATTSTMPGSLVSLPRARFDAATARAQLSARTRLEMRQVFRSPPSSC
jgi:ABC-2 type transport system permease protein